MLLVRDDVALAEALREARARGARVGFVPTMGYLHEGHASLIRMAASQADLVVVSDFVNPAQFGAGEDYDRYPRDLARDARVAEEAGADLLWAPLEEDVYPASGGFRVEIEPGSELGRLASELEGEARPGHFRGVIEVLTRLFARLSPCVAVFGEKDFQQLLVVRRFVEEVGFPVEVLGHPVVRESDGLACSSRNAYLSAAERKAAPVVHEALLLARKALEEGAEPHEAEALASNRIAEEPLAEVDYVAVRDASDLRPPGPDTTEVRVLAAVRFPSARLIDNEPATLPLKGRERAGTPASVPSVGSAEEGGKPAAVQGRDSGGTAMAGKEAEGGGA
jgi:pantoate--beta-alanine ligase